MHLTEATTYRLTGLLSSYEFLESSVLVIHFSTFNLLMAFHSRRVSMGGRGRGGCGGGFGATEFDASGFKTLFFCRSFYGSRFQPNSEEKKGAKIAINHKGAKIANNHKIAT